jgi:SAM-dependent methyltransferase
MSSLTGERPVTGVTPDSLLALHAAGYSAILERVGPGRLLDVGCGQGFESVRFLADNRPVVGVDYDRTAVAAAAASGGPQGLRVAQMNAERLAFVEGSFRWVCSSHLIEHFPAPESHVAEMARVVADNGTVFILTPNAPADFENPFHVHLFTVDSLRELLDRHFADVWVGALDGTPTVKADFAARRAKAQRILRLDPLRLRRHLPRSWYIGLYTWLLPIAYRFLASSDTGGATGITADAFSVTDTVDDSTLVLFGVARSPRRTRRS